MRGLILVWISMLMGLGLLALGAHTNELPRPETPSESSATSSPLKPTEKEVEKNTEIPTYHVVKVVDGDTVVIEKEGKNVTLRLIGLDAPETTTLRKGVIECFGDRATEMARALLQGVYVSIETDTSQDEYDKYGRLLVYVFLQNGDNFAERMIAEGYGHEYTYDLPYKYQARFRAAEAEARGAQKGLWNPAACASPATSQLPTAVIAAPGTYDCSKNAYNCSSFKRQAEAQSAFESCGGNENDVHKLDSDGDGRVCESLQ